MIRPARGEDLPALMRLYAQLNPDDPPPDFERLRPAWERVAAHPGCSIFVLEDAGAVVSTCTLLVIPNLTRVGQPYALIENVVTDRAARGRGHGGRVLAAAVEAAWAAGCYKVMLMTGSKRPETHRFYAGAGFNQNKTGYQIRRPDVPVSPDDSA